MSLFEVEAIDRKVCPRCGADALVTLAPDNSPHYAKVTCGCGHMWWLPKPTTPPTRAARAKNRRNLDEWRTWLGGELICFHCGVREGSYFGAGFEAHHGVDISEGGNTVVIPYCHDCHKAAERQRLYRQHVQARS